jgi:hypothetical protein
VNDVLGVSTADVWTVGIIFSPKQYEPAISHWDGSTWITVNVPANVITQDLSISPDISGQPQWAGAEAGINPSRTLYAYYDGTAWSSVPGATALSGVNDAGTVTAHIPGTDATWGVGESVLLTSQGLMPVGAIIEFNPGAPPS